MPTCTPAALADAAKGFAGLEPGVKQSIITYLLAVIAGGSTDPSTLAASSKGFKGVQDGVLPRIMAYLLCQIASGGGGGSVQDMQVAWTPSSLKLGQLMSFVSDISFGSTPSLSGITSLTFNQVTMSGAIDIESASDLLSISAPSLTEISGATIESLLIQGNPVLTSVSIPSLVDTPNASINISGNASLTTVNSPVYIPTPGLALTLTNNAFNAATVNLFLARCIASPTWGNAGENISLQGGTNAAPSGQGIADKATLQGRGATVNTN